MKLKKDIFYGWFVVLGAFFTLTAIIGIHLFLIGLYFPILSETFAFSNTELGTYFVASAFLAMAVANGVAGKLYQTVDIRWGVFISGLIAGGCYVAYAFATAKWQFIVLSLILGSAMAIGSMVPFSILITRWFIEKRATALSILSAGPGLASLLFSNYISSVLQSYGYQRAFITEGCVIFAFVTLGFLFIRSNPADMGLEPYGKKKIDTVENTSQQEENLQGMTFKEAKSSLQFYLLALAAIVLSSFFIGLTSQFPSYYLSIGYSSSQTASIIAILGIFLIVGTIIYGVVADKLGARWSNMLLFSTWVIGLIALVFADTSYLFIALGVLCTGIYGATPPVSLPLWSMQIFGEKEYGLIYGLISALSGVGSMLGAPLLGILIDTFSYKFTFSLLAVVCVAMYICITMAYALSKKYFERTI